jgi:hypothetical protein
MEKIVYKEKPLIINLIIEKWTNNFGGTGEKERRE